MASQGIHRARAGGPRPSHNRLILGVEPFFPSPHPYTNIPLGTKDRSGQSLQYNPKNHLVGPALSPNGNKLAIVREAMLEVYDLP